MAHPYTLLSERDRYDLAVGQMIHAWSLAETQITFLSVLLHSYGIGSRWEKHPPRALNKKLSMIRNCFEHDERLEALKPLAAKTCDAIDTGAVERNLLIHGSEFKFFDDLGVVRFRLDHFDWSGKPPEEMRPISVSQVVALIELATQIAPTTLSVTLLTGSILAPDKFDDALDEIGRGFA